MRYRFIALAWIIALLSLGPGSYALGAGFIWINGAPMAASHASATATATPNPSPTPEYVNGWSAAATSSGTTAPSVVTTSGSQIVAGDCLIAVPTWYPLSVTFSGITGGSGNTWSTAVTGFDYSSIGELAVYYRVAAAGDVGGTFSASFSATAYSALGIIDVRNTACTIDSHGTGSSGSSSDPSAASITIVNSGASLFWFSGISAAGTPGIPTGFTAAFPAVAYGAGNNFGISGGYLMNQSAGATGAQAASTSQTNWGAVMVGIVP